MLCPTAILMAALTTGIILADMWYLYNDRMILHFILGSIVTALFYALCQRGYEIVNWVLLASVVVVTLSSLVTPTTSVERDNDDSLSVCNTCNIPAASCPCANDPPSVPKCNNKPLWNPPTTSQNPSKPSCPTSVGPRVNMEDPTPRTREWYRKLRNM